MDILLHFHFSHFHRFSMATQELCSSNSTATSLNVITAHLVSCRLNCLLPPRLGWHHSDSPVPACTAAAGWCCPSGCYGDGGVSVCTPSREGTANLGITTNEYHPHVIVNIHLCYGKLGHVWSSWAGMGNSSSLGQCCPSLFMNVVVSRLHTVHVSVNWSLPVRSLIWL